MSWRADLRRGRAGRPAAPPRWRGWPGRRRPSRASWRRSRRGRRRAPSGTERVWTREDRLAAGAVRRRDDDAAVEAAGAQQRRVEHLGPVGGAEHDHALARGEAVHLGEDLVERLLALVVAAGDVGPAGGARAADRVELVDEDDRRGGLLGLVEQVAHARGADADDHLDELRGRHLEERHPGLAGDRAGQQRLAGARLAGEQHAARDPGAQLQVLVGVLEEVDDLGQLLLGLVDPGDVVEGDVLIGGLDAPRARAPERHQPAGAAAAGGGAAHEEDDQQDEQQRRAEAEDHAREERRAGVRVAWRRS